MGNRLKRIKDSMGNKVLQITGTVGNSSVQQIIGAVGSSVQQIKGAILDSSVKDLEREKQEKPKAEELIEPKEFYSIFEKNVLFVFLRTLLQIFILGSIDGRRSGRHFSFTIQKTSMG